MTRRDTLKSIIVTTAGAGLAATGLEGCATPDDGADVLAGNAAAEAVDPLGYLTPKERAIVDRLNDERFFSDHELATLTTLGHLILPASEAGSIEDAGVVEFLEFRTKDVPAYKLPLRGGLAWLDQESGRRFGERFVDLTPDQHRAILDDIAFHDPEVPEAERPQPQRFFALLRNLVVTGYYCSNVGYADLGYQGNAPNVWDGVPPEVLAKHGVAYDPVWIAKCVDQEQRDVVAAWDEAGNLVS